MTEMKSKNKDYADGNSNRDCCNGNMLDVICLVYWLSKVMR